MKLALAELEGASVVVEIRDDTALVLGEGDQQRLIDIAMRNEPPPQSSERVALGDLRLTAPVPHPPSIRDFFGFEEHVRNSRRAQGLEVDPLWYEQPFFYFTNPAAVIGPEDPVSAPRGTRWFDYELEVACVIGRQAADLDPEDPASLDVIAGFVLMNDWSARDVQVREMTQNLGPQKGKDFATSLGPWLATPDEFANFASGRPSSGMRARVNGEQWSSGNLADLHFTWMQLLAIASQDTKLVPGDVLGSGTCGTGCIVDLRATGHRDTRYWLRPGDVVELEADQLGVLRNRVIANPRSALTEV